MPGPPLPTAIGLGSNLGDPPALIRQAVHLLAEAGLADVCLSSLYRSVAVDCLHGTPDFVNAALIGLWGGSPRELLAACQGIERRLGRPFPHSSREARLIDLDILLLGECVLQTLELQLPHPRLQERLFALLPLSEVAPAWRIPPGNRTVAEVCRTLLARQGPGTAVERYGPGPAAGAGPAV
jgi:2-amino-4-hydroxy-6-hydroxymethyldihydropteridine diphosphokinase